MADRQIDRVFKEIDSGYEAPWWLQGGHGQTLIPALFGNRKDPGYQRERLELPDGDFIDLDWLRSGTSQLAILVHGLEGSAFSPYMVGMANALHKSQNRRDVLAMNFRGCSGHPNRTPRFYHSGETGDLRSVLNHVERFYQTIVLIGFSLGGNVVLKFLGEISERPHPKIRAGIAFSVPCHLESSAQVLARPANRLYMKRFLGSLRAKIQGLSLRFPGSVDLSGLEHMRTFLDFDGSYTAPLHGFRDAHDYWTQSSSRQFLPAIRIPSLMVNARNDPFLSSECFPKAGSINNPLLRLEYPINGGHIGFPCSKAAGMGWKESRAIRFMDTKM